MNTKHLKTKLIIASFLILSAAIMSAEDTFEANTLYSGLKKKPSIERDNYLADAINQTIIFTGIVVRTDTNIRYKRSFRAIIKDESASTLNLDIVYYVYIESEYLFNQFITGHKFNCTARIMAYTPMKTARDSYIIDVMLIQAVNIID